MGGWGDGGKRRVQGSRCSRCSPPSRVNRHALPQLGRDRVSGEREGEREGEKERGERERERQSKERKESTNGRMDTSALPQSNIQRQIAKRQIHTWLHHMLRYSRV